MVAFDQMTGGQVEHIRNELLTGSRPTGQRAAVVDVINSREEVVAYGPVGAKTLLINPYLPLDLVTNLTTAAPAEKTLLNLSRKSDILAAYIHEISSSYGLALYTGQHKAMTWYSQDNVLYANQFTEQLSEKYTALDSRNAGQFFFDVLDLFMGKPFSGWAFDETASLELYERQP